MVKISNFGQIFESFHFTEPQELLDSHQHFFFRNWEQWKFYKRHKILLSDVLFIITSLRTWISSMMIWKVLLQKYWSFGTKCCLIVLAGRGIMAFQTPANVTTCSLLWSIFRVCIFLSLFNNFIPKVCNSVLNTDLEFLTSI